MPNHGFLGVTANEPIIKMQPIGIENYLQHRPVYIVNEIEQLRAVDQSLFIGPQIVH